VTSGAVDPVSVYGLRTYNPKVAGSESRPRYSERPANAGLSFAELACEPELCTPFCTCRVRTFGRTPQKRLLAGKTEFGSSRHQIVARAVLI